MSDPTPAFGAVAWTDLTVGDAERIRDFYRDVAGWKPEPVTMGDYDDFNMVAESTGEPTAGVCHARGSNADIPAQWLIYITVPHLEASISRCRELGGEVIHGPRQMGDSRMCVIRDPAGAVCALYQP